MGLTSLTFVATGRADLERGGRVLILLANKTKIFMLKYNFQKKSRQRTNCSHVKNSGHTSQSSSRELVLN